MSEWESDFQRRQRADVERDRAKTVIPAGASATTWAEQQPTTVLLDFLRTKSESHAGTVDLAAVRAEIDDRLPSPWRVRNGLK